MMDQIGWLRCTLKSIAEFWRPQLLTSPADLLVSRGIIALDADTSVRFTLKEGNSAKL
jgi:hypothetical protein